jgi:hypothetical protein
MFAFLLVDGMVLWGGGAAAAAEAVGMLNDCHPSHCYSLVCQLPA